MSEAHEANGRRPQVPRPKGPGAKPARPQASTSRSQGSSSRSHSSAPRTQGTAGRTEGAATGRKPASKPETARVAVGGSARVNAPGREDSIRRPRKNRQGNASRHPGHIRLGDFTAPTPADGTQPPSRFPSILVGLVIITLFALIALGQPLSQWWKQHREYNAIAQSLAEAKAENARLSADLEKWNSDAFIASQARSRLGYIRPGETQYLVVDAPKEAQSGAGKQQAGPPRPWYLVVSDSVKMAESAPAPADKPSEGGGN
ncbi:MAG: septum formation initiator family protein [Actinomycetaceae bacterium]|nr:septum formation initiator family protein [Actinomycetaceae bacterium]